MVATDNALPMNEGVRFQIGCITKLMTSIVAAELINTGRLDTDDPIEKHLGELRGTEKGQNIAIWHLLSHTSGYRGANLGNPEVAYHYSWPKFLNFFKETPLFFKPGSVFSYEHLNHVILGEVIQRITGNDIKDLFCEMIINPLNLSPGSLRNNQQEPEMFACDHMVNPDTRQMLKVKPIIFGDFWKASLSDLTMSVSDMLHLASVICGIDPVPSGMSEKAMAFVQKQVVKLPRAYGDSQSEQMPSAFGVGCALYRGWLYGHNNSAQGQSFALRFSPQNKIALVIGINSWAPFLCDSIINHMFSVVRGQAIPPLPEEPFSIPLSDLAGTFLGPKGSKIVVVQSKNKITCYPTISNVPSYSVIIEKDENKILRVCNNTFHHSLSFFRDPDCGGYGMMFGQTAFRKQ